MSPRITSINVPAIRKSLKAVPVTTAGMKATVKALKKQLVAYEAYERSPEFFKIELENIKQGILRSVEAIKQRNKEK